MNEPAKIARLADKPFASHYLHVAAVIDAPVSQVWPHVLDIESWLQDHELETINGAPGTVGLVQRVRPRGLSEAIPRPHYHLYGIAHVVPERLIVLEVFAEKGGSYGITHDWAMFDYLIVSDKGDKTEVSFVMLDLTLGDAGQRARGHNPLSKDKEAESAHTIERLRHNFGNLKRLVGSH
jgi:hypothetical protein